MRADAIRADRALRVRWAARSWNRAGAIDAATLAAVETSYPDDRVRLGPTFRTLVFLFTMLAGHALFFLILATLSFHSESAATLAFLFGLGMTAATELLIGRFRRSQGGMEMAAATLAVSYLFGSAVWLAADTWHLHGRELALCLAGSGGLVLALADLRWGVPLFGTSATVCAFLLLAQAPAPRLVWALTALAVAPLLLRAGDSARLPPSHRLSCRGGLVVALAALYAAVHLGSWDVGFIELLRNFDTPPRAQPGPLRLFSILATAALPATLIVIGIRNRRRLLLDVGVVLGIASLVTLRFYVHLAPLWIALAVSGAGAILAALALRRRLDSGPDRERGGFTAEALFEDVERHGAIQAVAFASLAPAARSAVAQPRGFAGGGGQAGGGGASGDF